MDAALARTFLLRSESTPGAVAPRSAPRLCKFAPLPPHLPGQWAARSAPSAAPTEAAEPLPSYETFAEAFEKQGKRVLLLGAPGAGKSTTLLQFARDSALDCLAALTAAPTGNSPVPPVPLFVSVHAWDYKTPLARWALAQVQTAFPDLTLDGRPLRYIFDGLDELGSERPVDPAKPDGEKFDPRQRFLQAIKEQLREEQIVLSCRIADYEQIREKAALQGAVTLLPLSPERIEQFLRDQGQASLWDTLAADAHLLDLARTPLLLMLLSIAAGDSLEALRFDSDTVTANTIFDLYLKQRFVHESSKRELLFSEEETRDILGVLAAYMWRDDSSPSPTLSGEELERLIGTDHALFVPFARSLHLRDVFSGGTSMASEFIHLKFRDFCALPVLREALQDQDNDVRYYAVEALGDLGEWRNSKSLRSILDDTANNLPADMPKRVVANIKTRKDALAIPALHELLDDMNPRVARRAMDALVGIGRRAKSIFRQTLTHQDAEIRTQAATMLGNMGDAASVPALEVSARTDADTDVRAAAKEARQKIAARAAS